MCPEKKARSQIPDTWSQAITVQVLHIVTYTRMCPEKSLVRFRAPSSKDTYIRGYQFSQFKKMISVHSIKNNFALLVHRENSEN